MRIDRHAGGFHLLSAMPDQSALSRSFSSPIRQSRARRRSGSGRRREA
jgi:hypothetical protein